MKVVVDANIVFSGILNTSGKIGDVLINSFGLIDFIAPDFLRTEIRKHHRKLSKLSKLQVENIIEAEFLVCREIKFISEEQVLASTWQDAYNLVKEIDEKDVQYVAYAKQFNRKIWSGDRQLIRGLKKKGYDQFVKTDELIMTRKELEKNERRRKK